MRKIKIIMPYHALKLIFTASIIYLFALNKALFALPSDRQQPINIEADQALFDQINAFTEYMGSVTLEQGSLLIEADRIEIFQDAEQQLKKVLAFGSPVSLKQQTLDNEGNIQWVQAEAKNLHYSVISQQVELSGEAQMRRENTEIISERIVYNIQTDVFSASNQASDEKTTADTRVKITIPAREINQTMPEN